MATNGRGARGTDEVFNQSPPFADYNIFLSDRVLQEAVVREGGADACADLSGIGGVAGSAEVIAWGEEANRFPPELTTHRRTGERIDEVRFHPSWHRLMEKATAFGLHGTAWGDPRRGAHVARAAAFFVWNQVEAGHGCPISMTYAAVPALRAAPELAAVWEPLLRARAYEPALAPASQKASALCAMQRGSRS